MTLILAALCRDDICVCADTRYVDQKWPNGFKDGFDKIYKFEFYPLIVLNHGVNKFNGKYWNDYCEEYEKSYSWRGKNLKLISKDFRAFIENIILQQLEFNAEHWPNDSEVGKTGFALCGKNSENNNFEMHEFFWNPDYKYDLWSGVRLNGFGTGYDEYLKNDINNFVNWNNFNRIQIKEELVRLFSIAKKKKNLKNGREFSDDFTIKSLLE